MSLAHYFTHIAHLIGHPSRALMLDALLGAEALPATALAESAGISAQTASRHLQLLADAGLLRVQQQGKFRYFRIADNQVYHLLQQLAEIRLGSKPQSVMAGEPALHTLRRCYDHMAGRQGVALTQALLAQQKLLADAANGRFVITDAGRLWLETLDIAASQPHTAWCMDWTEQVPHIAGWLGAALFDAFAARSYVHASATAPRVLHPEIAKLVDFIVSDELLAIGDKVCLERLYKEILNKDWFMTLLDLEDYIKVKDHGG